MVKSFKDVPNPVRLGLIQDLKLNLVINIKTKTFDFSGVWTVLPVTGTVIGARMVIFVPMTLQCTVQRTLT